MKGLYLLLDLLTLFFPLVLSFDKKVYYFKSWKAIFLSSTLFAIPFLIWDYLFTINEFWGFNPAYLIGIEIFHLPIEEVLFFFVVPFACNFIYECLKAYFPNFKGMKMNVFWLYFIPLYTIILILSGEVGWYTLTISFSSALAIFYWLRNFNYSHIGLAFLVCFVPFMLVNGILTGGVTEEPIVWYSEAQKSPYRIWTVPMEDLVYNFSLLVPTILLAEFFKKKWQ